MEIIQPRPYDLIEIVYLQRVCYFELQSRGWLSCDLFKEFTLGDLKNIFILKLNSLTLTGFIKFNLQINDSKSLDSLNSISSNPLLIENIIVHPNWWSKNAGKILLNFAEEYARKNGFTSIRLNTFAENNIEIKLFEQQAFGQTGEFHSPHQKIPYYSYEKIL